jgi:hypothetical protein
MVQIHGVKRGAPSVVENESKYMSSVWRGNELELLNALTPN